jgi:hypothetical protein
MNYLSDETLKWLAAFSRRVVAARAVTRIFQEGTGPGNSQTPNEIRVPAMTTGVFDPGPEVVQR